MTTSWRKFGGAPGIRDDGALESALMRPQIGYYDSLIEESAALLESLAMNHPFVDGNKRTALGTTDAFLGMKVTSSTVTAVKPTTSSCTCSRPIRSGSTG